MNRHSKHLQILDLINLHITDEYFIFALGQMECLQELNYRAAVDLVPPAITPAFFKRMADLSGEIRRPLLPCLQRLVLYSPGRIHGEHCIQMLRARWNHSINDKFKIARLINMEICYNDQDPDPKVLRLCKELKDEGMNIKILNKVRLVTLQLLFLQPYKNPAWPFTSVSGELASLSFHRRLAKKIIVHNV